MSAVAVIVAVIGCLVSAMVITAMVLLTPRGTVNIHVHGTDAQGSNLSGIDSVPAPAADA